MTTFRGILDMFSFRPERGKRAAARRAALAIALFPLLAFAQMEPCGLYESDGQPGYGPPDMWFTASFWRQQGAFPTVPDFNGDGMVDIRDMVRQANCTPGLGHGLAGRYYGFNDGTDDQEITFPDFDNLPGNPDPAVVRATETLNYLDGFRGFMDSELRHQFGSVYEGYLFVPETANYTLHIFANRGMRVILDGNQILEVDIWPPDDTTTLPLSYGLHPIKVEFYVSSNFGRALLDWSSDGSVIGPTAEPISPLYFYHGDTVVPQHAVTDVELLLDPPTGSRVTSATVNVEAFALGPNPDLSLFIDDQEQVLADGFFQESFNLQPGLNRFEMRVSDGDNRTKTTFYHLYYDAENLTTNGLATEIYATEVNWLLPDTTDLEPYDVVVNPGTQLSAAQDDSVTIGNRVLRDGNFVRLKGTIEITNPGNYLFYVGEQHALYINGEIISGIWAEFAGQWDTYNEIFLEAGRHHYQIETYSYWGGPILDVRWAFEGGAETPIPNAVFRHGPSHLIPAKRLPAKKTGGRVADQLMAEYLFEPGQVFNDTSGGGNDLIPDPRAIPRAGGGITYQSAGSLSSEQAGVHAVAAINQSRALSLEADFIYEKDVQFDWTSRLLTSLTSLRGTYHAALECYNDSVRFWIHGGGGNYRSVEADGVVVKDSRIHAVGTYDGSTVRLYIDGVLVDSSAFTVDFDAWHNLVTVNVGQRNSRHVYSPSIEDQQMFGTFLAGAVYAKALSSGEVNTNRQQNLLINPNPGPLPAPPVEAFPPAGASQAQLEEAFHILNRLSFGPSAESVAEVIAQGVDPWINSQLDPANIDDSELDDILASDWFRPTDFSTGFRARTLFRMIQSKRQLLEVMTQFWENHFNTQFDKVENIAEEYAENERFRELALGNFGDLLLASAMNYPMTVYLDNISNVVGAPNENYGRELFELFSMGVNNGYTQADIVEAARCFTGWTVQEGKFYFNPGFHDFAPKQVLGLSIPAGGGLSDGVQLIQHVVSRVETADFISWKLCQLFIADDPPQDVVDAASNTFQLSGGDITQVLQTIFSHARFRTDLAYRGNKVKTPLEFITSAARISDSFPVTSTMVHYLADMGMTLFNYAEPTGFAEEGVNWIDTNSLLTRWNLINDLTSNRGNGRNMGLNFKNYIEKRGLTTSNELLDFFSSIVTFGQESAGVRPLAEAWMTDNNPGGFTLTDTVLDERVRQTYSLYLRLPEFNKQ